MVGASEAGAGETSDDAAILVDAGAPLADAEPDVIDAGPRVLDAGPNVSDAEPPPTDAMDEQDVVPTTDGGDPTVDAESPQCDASPFAQCQDYVSSPAELPTDCSLPRLVSFTSPTFSTTEMFFDVTVDCLGVDAS